MRNKLEDEYRQLMQSQTPDLWDRIEAGIQNVEQKQPEKLENQDSKTESHKAKDSGIEDPGNRNGKTKRKQRNRGRYALPVAACVAACICIPLAITGVLKTGILRPMKAENQAADMAMPEMAEDSMADAELAEEEAMDEGAPEEPGAGEECAAAKGTDDASQRYGADTGNASQDAAEDNAYNRGSADGEGTDSLAGTTMATEMADQAQEKEELQKQQSIRLHILEITSSQDFTKEDGKNGILYRVRTVENDACTVYVDSLDDFSLEDFMKNAVESGRECEILVIGGNGAYDYEYAGKAE